jgi:hypothetical protein
MAIGKGARNLMMMSLHTGLGNAGRNSHWKINSKSTLDELTPDRFQ